MNCKPGDVAYVVRSTSPLDCFRTAIGSPLEVTTALETPFGIAWKYKGRALRCANCGSYFAACLDADLQPTRPAPPADETPTEIIEAITA